MKGSAAIANLAASEHMEDDSTRLWQMRLGHTGEIFLQALAKQGSVKCASTFNLN